MDTSVESIASPRDLAKRVQQFTEDLKTGFRRTIARRPKAFRNRVLRLIRVQLPPYPGPRGRPKDPTLTAGFELYRTQKKQIEQGTHTHNKLDWPAIARVAHPGFETIKNPHKRRSLLARVRNSIYTREADENGTRRRRMRRRTRKIQPEFTTPK